MDISGNVLAGTTKIPIDIISRGSISLEAHRMGRRRQIFETHLRCCRRPGGSFTRSISPESSATRSCSALCPVSFNLLGVAGMTVEKLASSRAVLLCGTTVSKLGAALTLATAPKTRTARVSSDRSVNHGGDRQYGNPEESHGEILRWYNT